MKQLNDSQLSKEAICEIIKQSSFFSDFKQDEIEILADWVKIFSAEAGCVILNEGDNSHSFCVIIEGHTNIFKALPNNEHVKIADIGVNESIGEISMIDGSPFSASAIASEKSIVLLMMRDDFNMVITKHLEVGNKLLWKLAKILSERLRRTTTLLAESLTNKND